MHVWALWLSCETPEAPPDRAAGARTRQLENSKCAHFRAPALQTPPKFKDPKREKEERNLWRRREKKREILGPPPFGPSTLWPPHPSEPHFFQVWASRAPHYAVPKFNIQKLAEVDHPRCGEEAQAPVLAPLPKMGELQQQIDDLVRERELLRASQSCKHP